MFSISVLNKIRTFVNDILCFFGSACAQVGLKLLGSAMGLVSLILSQDLQRAACLVLLHVRDPGLEG